MLVEKIQTEQKQKCWASAFMSTNILTHNRPEEPKTLTLLCMFLQGERGNPGAAGASGLQGPMGPRGPAGAPGTDGGKVR